MSFKIRFICGIFILLLCAIGEGFAGIAIGEFLELSSLVGAMVPPDSLDTDSIKPYEPSRRPNFGTQDYYGNSMTDRLSRSSLYLGLPSNIDTDVQIDDSLKNFTITEKVGDDLYRPPTTMSYDRFYEMRKAEMDRQYFMEKTGSKGDDNPLGNDRSLIPKIYLSPAFDRIFGGNYVDIRPNGFVTLDFGARWQRVDNPAIPIRQQRNGGFNFDQQISMNLVGNVGEKLKITANWDTKASFEFENQVKVDYQGFEEDIIQDIEAGNISFNPPSALIQGSQNLMGVKTKLKFGKLNVEAVVSNQRGRTESITISSGGVQNTEFDIPVSDYDEDRHFFLSHYFRDNYETWLENYPIINSGVIINRVEVYVTNRNQETQSQRNMIAFTDLGEARPGITRIQDNAQFGFTVSPNAPVDNENNNLYQTMRSDQAIRNDGTVANLEVYGLLPGQDFETIDRVRKLTESEYSIHPKLGYITIHQSFQQDVVVAVAFEYSVNGRNYKVGELQEDYSNLGDRQNIYLKLLRPSSSPLLDNPTWDLMMKNVYSLGANQISQQNFEMRVIYRDDASGVDNPSLHEGGPGIKDVPLVQLLEVDKLNPNNDPGADGNFDFVDNSTNLIYEPVTIDVRRGKIFFTKLEPFGSYLREEVFDQEQGLLANKYAFDTLYTGARAIARLQADKNKFRIKGSYQGSAGSEINLPGFNIARGSVKVFAGSSELTEGQQFTVNYNLGSVLITDEGVLNSGSEIRIQYEKADLFNFQQRSLFGARLDYKLNRDVNLGGTFMMLNERPIITRVNIGDEPTKNVMVGMDMSMSKDSRLLTKMVDAIPLISTKEKSSVTVNAEAAYLIPGSHRRLGSGGNSYIDDFEGAEIPYDFTRVPNSWKLASTPLLFPESSLNGLEFGYNRARLAWYTIDNVFYRQQGRGKPDHITQEQLANHYVRAVGFNEVFPNRQGQAVNFNEFTFDLAFFPTERGPYNYNPNLSEIDLNTGKFRPEVAKSKWAGITRPITFNNNFDAANIEYIEFWLMDPFLDGDNGRVATGPNGTEGNNNTTGGTLFFNLGDISEDVLKDGKYSFENGLPPVGATETTEWAQVPTISNVTRAFDNDPDARNQQDIGLDGLNNEGERNFGPYQPYINAVSQIANPEAAQRLLDDPSNDDFVYYLQGDYPVSEPSVIERYKKFNGNQGNSPAQNNSNLFTPSNSPLPDDEDLNQNFNVDPLNRYFQYKIDLKPAQMQVGNGYITDRVVANVNGEDVSWYQFRIPIRELENSLASQEGGSGLTFNSIKWMRMFLTGWEEPVVLRFVNLQLVSSQWRRYEDEFAARNTGLEPVNDQRSNLFISTVNIEENGQGDANNSPYVLPPGVIRDFDNTSQVSRQLNEQSLQICVDDLRNDRARAVFKNVTFDFLNYKRLRMYVHAHSPDQSAEDGEMAAFIRIGTDFEDNYYEVSIPLDITDPGAGGSEEIWPESNEFDILFDDLTKAKALRRERNGLSPNPDSDVNYYEYQNGKYTISVKGNPDLSNVLTVMLGVRNLYFDSEQLNEQKSICLWFNELRVAEFDKNAGWAATARVNSKLADFATVTTSGKYVTEGFGAIGDKISDRSRSTQEQYDIQSNINVDKFIPETVGLKVPFFVRYERSRVTPKFDPLDPDVRLENKLDAIEAESGAEVAKEYEDKVTTNNTIRSFRVSNLQKIKTNPNAKSRIYDIENLNLSAGYTENLRNSPTIAVFKRTNHTFGIGYNYSAKNISIEPFKKLKFLDKAYLKLIKDFNLSPFPNSYTVRGDLNRDFTKTQNLNNELNTIGMETFYQKLFTFNRTYAVRWNITKSLSLNYNVNVRAIIDEPEGEPNKGEYRDELFQKIGELGRMTNYTQTVVANYKVPLSKIPLIDWMNADVSYTAGYDWNAASRQVVRLGNSISNRQTSAVNGRIDMLKLYNKSKFLKEVNQPRRRTVRRTPARNNNNAKQDSTQKEKKDLKGLKAGLRILMSLKSINGTYTLTRNTFLPGYMPEVDIVGVDRRYYDPGLNYATTSAPGWKFIMGDQNPDIRIRAAQNGWLTRDQNFFSQFSQGRTETIQLRTSLEPIRDFRIQLDAKRSKSDNYSEQFRYSIAEFDSLGNIVREAGFPEERGFQPQINGNYTISTISIKTAFSPNATGRKDVTEVFQQFENNRAIVKARLDQENPNGAGYDLNNQEVLISSFFMAYTGRDAGSSSIEQFPAIPLPNWRVDYAGLGKVKWLKKKFSSINLNHAYSSTYAVSNYNSSGEYIESSIDLFTYELQPPYPTIKTEKDSIGFTYVPVFIIPTVTINESFSPLFGVNVRTKSKINASFEYRVSRNVSLNVNNRSVTEINNNDYVVSLGYTRAGMKLPFRVQGRTVTLKNDLTMRTQVTFRDSETTQRLIDQNGLITAGNFVFQLRPTIEYMLNQRLSLQAYFERNVNNPKISTSFKSTSTAFGIQLRFSLSG
ncbi:MAG: cell surface protein SprA [Cytophagales bacterium]